VVRRGRDRPGCPRRPDAHGAAPRRPAGHGPHDRPGQPHCAGRGAARPGHGGLRAGDSQLAQRHPGRGALFGGLPPPVAGRPGPHGRRDARGLCRVGAGLPVRGGPRAGVQVRAGAVPRRLRGQRAPCGRGPGPAAHGRGQRRRARRGLRQRHRPHRHDLRALQGRHQPQRDRGRPARAPGRRADVLLLAMLERAGRVA
jgi:hypothetical protein